MGRLTPQSLNLSVVILTKNEEVNLPACLDSVRGWDVWVIDSGSTDATVKIAKEAGAHVRLNSWRGYAAQRTWALERLPLREFVFMLDADERVDPELRADIERFCVNPKSMWIDGAMVARKFIFLGRWIRWGNMWPRWHLRLVRRSSAWVEPNELDERLQVKGRTVRLNGAIIHEDRRGLKEWVLRHIKYAELQPPEPRLYRMAPKCWRALGYFLWRYVGQLGILDGPEGLVFHSLHALAYRVLRDGFALEEARRLCD